MNRERYSKDPERFKKYQKKYRNTYPEKLKKSKQKEYNKNKASYLKRAREREKRLAKATPPWLTLEQKAHINRTYKLRDIISEATKITYHVDHIVPIKGKNVCGLHVPWNLLVISAKENLAKNNSY